MAQPRKRQRSIEHQEAAEQEAWENGFESGVPKDVNKWRLNSVTSMASHKVLLKGSAPATTLATMTAKHTSLVRIAHTARLIT
jgi:hypothetical protein